MDTTSPASPDTEPVTYYDDNDNIDHVRIIGHDNIISWSLQNEILMASLYASIHKDAPAIPL